MKQFEGSTLWAGPLGWDMDLGIGSRWTERRRQILTCRYARLHRDCGDDAEAVADRDKRGTGTGRGQFVVYFSTTTARTDP